MSYEQWIDSKAAGSERGLSLRQAYEAGEVDGLHEKLLGGYAAGRKQGQREMLEKVRELFGPYQGSKKPMYTNKRLIRANLAQLAKELDDG